jgi:hypothetical protein
VADEDNDPDIEVGGCTLFLFYLKDQLGYRIEDIINAGAHTLSGVYENLKGDKAVNAWGQLSTLINTYYPIAADANGNFPTLYQPALETVFPVTDLVAVGATPQVSWVASSNSPTLTVVLSRQVLLPLMVSVVSDHPQIIPSPSVTIPAFEAAITMPFTVLAQDANFISQAVTLTASYAGTERSVLVMVESPNPQAMPALVIDVDRSQDPCRPLYFAGTSSVPPWLPIEKRGIVGEPISALNGYLATSSRIARNVTQA